jgi:hypothetical protein
MNAMYDFTNQTPRAPLVENTRKVTAVLANLGIDLEGAGIQTID